MIIVVIYTLAGMTPNPPKAGHIGSSVLKSGILINNMTFELLIKIGVWAFISMVTGYHIYETIEISRLKGKNDEKTNNAVNCSGNTINRQHCFFILFIMLFFWVY